MNDGSSGDSGSSRRRDTAPGPDCGCGILFLAAAFVVVVAAGRAVPVDLRAPPRLPPVPSLRRLADLFCASAGATSPSEGLAAAPPPRRRDCSPGSSMATRGFGFGPRRRLATDDRCVGFAAAAVAGPGAASFLGRPRFRGRGASSSESCCAASARAAASAALDALDGRPRLRLGGACCVT